MTVTEEPGVEVAAGSPLRDGPEPSLERRDLQQTFRLLLATVWLTDAALQLQPFMFTKGGNGFSGMLHGMAHGNPSWIAHTITWNASIVSHQPVLTNAVFAGTQFLIAFGIAWQRTCRAALGAVSRVGGSRVVVRRGSRRPVHGRGHASRGRPGRRPVLRRVGRAPVADFWLQRALRRRQDSR